MRALDRFVGADLDGFKNLAWFGFAADPPTLSHRAVVDAILSSGFCDRVIVFPAGKVDYKSFEATDLQRLEMVELWKEAAGFGPEVIVSRFDLLRDKAYYWADLCAEIYRMAPLVNHFFVVGSKDYNEIETKWHRGAELLECVRFLVVPRKGFSIQTLHKGDRIVKVPPIPGSSTNVRLGDLSGVDEKVREYILEQHLYR